MPTWNCARGVIIARRGQRDSFKRTLHYIRMMSDARFLVRMDSGNDSLENIKVCRQENAHYIIKRNLRKESREEWLSIAMEDGELEESRPGKEVWRGERYVKRTGIAEPLRIVYRVTKRTVEADGQVLLLPKVAVERVTGHRWMWK